MSIPPYWLWLKPILSLVLHLVANLKSLLSTGWAYVTRTGEEGLQSLYWQFKMNSFHANNNSTKLSKEER